MKYLGLGKKCPRCLGPKPKGGIGIGIALSRRGKAYICSDCGTDEAIHDLWIKRGETLDVAMLVKEYALGRALKKSGGLKSLEVSK